VICGFDPMDQGKGPLSIGDSPTEDMSDVTRIESPPRETPLMDRTTFLDYCKMHQIDPIQRMLLLSDGTLVDHLEALYLSPVRLSLQHQREVPMPDADADWLGVPRGCPTVERRTFLRAGGTDAAGRIEGERGGSPDRIVVFAVSLFPRSSLPSELCEEMLRGELPVGKLIRALPTQRDRMEVAYRPVPPLSEALGVSDTKSFWTRRYRLNLAGGGVGLVFEAFPPRAIFR